MWLKIACRSAFFLKGGGDIGGEHSCFCWVQVELGKQREDSSILAEQPWGKRGDEGWERTRERWAEMSGMGGPAAVGQVSVLIPRQLLPGVLFPWCLGVISLFLSPCGPCQDVSLDGLASKCSVSCSSFPDSEHKPWHHLWPAADQRLSHGNVKCVLLWPFNQRADLLQCNLHVEKSGWPLVLGGFQYLFLGQK